MSIQILGTEETNQDLLKTILFNSPTHPALSLSLNTMATTTSPSRATFADRADTYQAALQSLFSGKAEDTEADLSRLFTPTFTQQGDGDVHDFPAWVRHVRWLRQTFSSPGSGSISLTVTHFLREGDQLADRHLGTMAGPDGTVLGRSETFMWVEIAEDGRIERIVETVIHLGEDGQQVGLQGGGGCPCQGTEPPPLGEGS
jgi:hypothetical protein